MCISINPDENTRDCVIVCKCEKSQAPRYVMAVLYLVFRYLVAVAHWLFLHEDSLLPANRHRCFPTFLVVTYSGARVSFTLTTDIYIQQLSVFTTDKNPLQLFIRMHLSTSSCISD